MKRIRISAILLSLAAIILANGCGPQSTTKRFDVTEATIANIHDAFQSGDLSCRQLVETYFERIDAYDQPTKLNAIVVTNDKALERADELDEEFRSTGKLRALHCIPLIVKDNYDTKDLQTAGGSLALKGSIPPDDAYQVRVLREAGAIVLAKSNMAEWAFSPYQTVSSIAGTTLNPYALDRVPAGSSGGTAAAVAASFGAVGLGTDTGNSIRGPSSHTSLAGIRSTIGLTSRDGIVPLYLRNDIGGPMARTVEDAVRIFQVIAGHDPADPSTAACIGRVPEDYMRFLDKDGLKGARIGVLRALIDTPEADPEVKELMNQAIHDLRNQGA
ncbi:MAG: amidase family protein, partial [bacterium]